MATPKQLAEARSGSNSAHRLTCNNTTLKHTQKTAPTPFWRLQRRRKVGPCLCDWLNSASSLHGRHAMSANGIFLLWPGAVTICGLKPGTTIQRHPRLTYKYGPILRSIGIFIPYSFKHISNVPTRHFIVSRCLRRCRPNLPIDCGRKQHQQPSPT